MVKIQCIQCKEEVGTYQSIRYLGKDFCSERCIEAHTNDQIENEPREEISIKELNSIENVANLTQSKLLMKRPREATEVIVNYIINIEHIYTTRDDEKAEVWIYKEGIYIPEGKTYIKETCRKVLCEGYTNHLCNEVISKIEAETFIRQDEFFTVNNINRIAVQNGIVDLIEKKLYPFNPDEKHFNKLPIVFDETQTCEFIQKHLKTVLQDELDVPVLQELFGYLLYREYKIEKAFMFVGSGRNGKSKTLELMKRFIGSENCSALPLRSIFCTTAPDHTQMKITGSMKNP